MISNVLAKGLYGHPQISGFITAKQYLFIARENKRYVAVRFSNDSGFAIDEICLELLQLDGKGNILKKTRITESGTVVFAGTTFTLKSNPELDDKCVDVKVRIIYVISGAYRYTVRRDCVTAHYIAPRKIPKKRREIYTRQGAEQPKRRLFTLIVIALIVAMIGANVVQITIPFFEELGVVAYISELIGLDRDREEEDKPISGTINKVPLDAVYVPSDGQDYEISWDTAYSSSFDGSISQKYN